jgi:uncharacterized protein YceK
MMKSMMRQWSIPLALGLASLAGCASVHSDDSVRLRKLTSDTEGSAGSGHPKTTAARRAGIDGGATGSSSGTKLRADAAVGESDGAAVVPATDAADRSSPSGMSNDGTTEVWIGQLWSPGPRLCEHPSRDGTIERDGHFERAVLILELGAVAGPKGRIQLGQDIPPAAPPTDDETRFMSCTSQRPSDGFEYTLLEPVLTSTRLTLAISPMEIWDTWCATQLRNCTPDETAMDLPGSMHTDCVYPSWCTCEDGRCRANQQRRIIVNLALTNDSIEGELPILTAEELPMSIRLRRVE